MEERKEIRNTAFQVSVDEESRKVEGYAFLFDTKSDGLPFEEWIARGAADGVLAESDVFALLNHDQNRGVLGRWKGKAISLMLEVDQKGLRYNFEAPKTALGDELLENIRRGEVDQSSFAFTVKEDKWEKKGDGTWKRTIIKFDKIYDVSPVYNAAYSKTSVYMRGKEQEETRQREAELAAYYDEIEKSFQNF